MKKRVSLLLVLVIGVTMLAGCSKDEVRLNFSEYQTLRSFGQLTDETIKMIKEEEGVKDIKANEDGSSVVIMEKEAHKEMIKDLKEQLEELIKHTETSSEFSFIDSIETSDDYSKVDVYINKKELEIFKAKNKKAGGDDILDAFGFSLGSVVSTYKAYEGTGDKLVINYIDSKTKEEIYKIEFPKFVDDILEKSREAEPEENKTKEEKKEDK